MKGFRGFIKKEWLHIFRDKRSLLILFGMPLVQILLFGYAIRNEIKDAGIAVLDNANDEISRQLTDKIISSGYFFKSKTLKSYSEIDKAFKDGSIKLAVIFENDLSKNFKKTGSAGVQIITDASDPNTANTLSNYLVSIINDYIRQKNSVSANMLNIQPVIRMRYNPGLDSVAMFVPGLITIILMLISALMTSISLTREKESGTMELLLASPMKPAAVIIAKVIPYLLLSFAISLMILLIGFFVFGVGVQGNLVFLLLEMTLFIMTALSLGILISTVSETQQVALMISLAGLMLPTILLTGFIFPIENMPEILQWVAQLIPAKWFMEIIKGIMLKGLSPADLWFQTVVLMLFTLFFIVVSIKKYKIRL